MPMVYFGWSRGNFIASNKYQGLTRNKQLNNSRILDMLGQFDSYVKKTVALMYIANL